MKCGHCKHWRFLHSVNTGDCAVRSCRCKEYIHNELEEKED